MTAKCPACRGRGSQREVIGQVFGRSERWRTCRVCKGRRSLAIITEHEAKLLGCWMPPKDVAGFKANLQAKST